jgi:alpha-beta hydrolase superfamily lysophospholipase
MDARRRRPDPGQPQALSSALPRALTLSLLLCLAMAPPRLHAQAAQPGQPEVQSRAAPPQPLALRLRASDGVRLGADWWRCARPGAGLIVVVPGFAQRKGTGTMHYIAALLTPTADVLVLDLRGTGDSDSLFTFGAREYLDAQAALAWAQGRYTDVSLLGFSLGAYTALRACVEGPLRPGRALLVSLPQRLESVISSGGLFSFLARGLWQQRSDALARDEDADTLFRWGPPFLRKPRATDLARRAALPLHFLAGAQDLLVYPGQSRAAFDAAPAPATWTLWPDGRHAEHMALRHPAAFAAWVRACLRFRGADKETEPFGGAP